MLKEKKKKTHSAKKRLNFNENELLLEKIGELKFPELKEKLSEKYKSKTALRRIDNSPVKFNSTNKDSKLFMDVAERFLNNKPYNVECNSKLTTEENMNKLREKVYEQEKLTYKRCEKKFDKIISAFEKDKKLANGSYSHWEDDYESENENI